VNGPLGAILVGGMGRRLGGEKALVELCGRPLISYPVEAMRGAVGEVAVIAKADTRLPELRGVRVVREASAVQHPLVGLRQALAAAGGRGALVCAVDLPLVDGALLRRLSEADPAGAPAVVAASRGEVQPLLGCYQPSAVELLPEGGALRDVVAAIGARTLEVPDPQALFNVNTPDDLRRAEKLLGQKVRNG
jgi:molybdopterin-guanine dinucleotide biosynthesis protein A